MSMLRPQKSWFGRVSLGTVTFAVCFRVTLGGGALAGGSRQVTSLKAAVVSPSKPLRAGQRAAITVEVKNVSREALAISFDAVPKSYIFVTEPNQAGVSHSVARAADEVGESDVEGCSERMAVFVLRPGQTVDQVIVVEVPKKASGRATIDVVLGLRYVSDPTRCGSTTPLEADASGVVSLTE